MAQTRTVTTTPVVEKTPTRGAPRVAVQSATKIGIGRNVPVNLGRVLNVSMGGALLLVTAKLEKGAAIQIELGEPIFPIARLISAHVMHVDRAPTHLLANLEQKGKGLDKKTEAYLLGCEFIALDEETRETLAKYIKEHLDEERKRRTGSQQEDAKIRTARDRLFVVRRPMAPPWAYALGMVTGAYVIATGVWQNEDDLSIALHAAAALAIFWIAGRVASGIWLHLESWRTPEATIIATTDGTTSDVVQALADADSALDVPIEEDEKSSSAPAETAPGATDIATLPAGLPSEVVGLAA